MTLLGQLPAQMPGRLSGWLQGRSAWWWLLLTAAWFAATAWARPLMLPDEGRYVGVAWEMLRSGDWLTPTLDGLPFFHKPPLFYWITAAAMAVLGPNEWAGRAAPILGASSGAFALFLFVRRWYDERTARTALLVLSTQPFFFVGAQYANLDMLVAGCIGVTILLLAHAALGAMNQGGMRRGVLAAAYGCAGLGVLAKGLIGVVLPALVMLCWLLALRRWRLIFSLLWWPGVLLLLVVAAPWFIAMQMRYPAFLDYFFVVQHFKRFTEGGFNNAQPFWFYPAVLALLCLPWFVWLYPAFKRSYLGDPRLGPVRMLMWLWLLVVVIFFSLPQSKLVGYVLPAVPPMSLLIADGALGLAVASRWRQRGWQISAAVAVLICVGVVLGLSLHRVQSTKPLALALRLQQSPGDPVVFVNSYFYDIPFYARLRDPVAVVDTWHDPEIAQRDNWRKELADAAGFATPEAAAVLLTPDRLTQRLCQSTITWLVSTRTAAAGLPFLAEAREIAGTEHDALWRVDHSLPAMATALGCPGTPNAGSTSK